MPEGNGTAHLTMKLPYRPPYDWAGLMEFLSMRATPGVEQITSNAYRRTVSVDDRTGILDRVRDDGAGPRELQIVFTKLMIQTSSKSLPNWNRYGA